MRIRGALHGLTAPWTCVVALAVAAALAACPGARPGPPPERFVPSGALAAVVVPELGRASRELSALLATVAGFPGAGDPAALRGAVAAQLGFDPLDPKALADAGFDPARGAVLALVERPEDGRPRKLDLPEALLVLPVADAGDAEALLARLARDRLGATARTNERRGASTLVRLAREDGAGPHLAYALAGRHLLVSSSGHAVEVVAAALAIAPEASLASAPAFAAVRRAAGEGHALLAVLPPGSPLSPAALREGAALGLSASPGRLRLRAAVLPGARADAFARLAGNGAGGKLAARLDPASTLVVRVDGDPATIGARLLAFVPARDRAALAARGLDLERDLAGVLAPGGALAASLSPAFTLAALQGSAYHRDPAALVELEAVAPVREGAAEALARWSRSADPAHPPAAGPDGVVRVPTPSGELAWKLEGGRLALACGRRGRIDALLARLGGAGAGWTPPSASAGAALDGGIGGLVLDVPRLAASVRALPPSAFGMGPTGFMVRSMVDRFAEPALRVSALWSAAGLSEGALVVTVEAEIRPAEARP